MKNRRAIRKYKAEQITDEELNASHTNSMALGYADCEHPAAKPRKEDYIVRV